MSETENKAVSRQFDTLLQSVPKVKKPFPLLTESAKELLAFDLEQRHQLAGVRVHLEGDEGKAAIAELQKGATSRGTVEPSRVVEATPKKKKRRKKKKKPSNPPTQTSGEPTDAQRQIANKLKNIRKD